MSRAAPVYMPSLRASPWSFCHTQTFVRAFDSRPQLTTLQAGFVAVARANAGNVVPCGLEAASATARFNVSASAVTLATKAFVMGGGAWEVAPLPAASGVECDPMRLEARIDWSAPGALTQGLGSH